eukprot:7690194-Karenia_brevis.AAC.1
MSERLGWTWPSNTGSYGGGVGWDRKSQSASWQWWQHGGAATAKKPWKCSSCGALNKSKNACPTCGLKKSYAEVVRTPSST